MPFGPERYELKAENEDGSPDTQAGSHPFQLTSTLDFNQKLEPRPQFPQVGGRQPAAPALVKDLRFELPPGLIGNPTPFAQCTDLEFGTLGPNDFNLCPPDTAVGVVSVTASEPAPGSKALFTLAVPLFNLTPAPGEPARFGFEALQVPVILDTSVRSGRDYGVNVSVSNTSEAVSLLSSRVTFWGVPGDPRHDQSRGWSCLDGESLEITALGTCPIGLGASQPPALLTLPTSCRGQLQTTMQANSWAGDTPPPRTIRLPGRHRTAARDGRLQPARLQPLDPGNARYAVCEHAKRACVRRARATGLSPGRYGARASGRQGHDGDTARRHAGEPRECRRT